MKSSSRRILDAVALGILGVGLTGALAVHVAQKPGVYYAASHVRFLPPKSTANPNSLLYPNASVTALAGTVGRMVESNPPIGHVVSPTITLVDQGIRQGWSVTLPNDGGQFTNDFDQPLLQVQAVGRTAADVRSKVHDLVAQINADLTLLQDRAQVPSIDRITTSQDPTQLQVTYRTNSRGRALAAVLVIGLGATMFVNMLLRRWREGRGERPLDGLPDPVS